MHVVQKSEFSLPARGRGLLARAASAILAWQARETERRLLLSLNERLREDSGLGQAPRGTKP